MSKVTLSIIIPTFNEEDFIKDCLDALMKQKDEIDEIILVDNNSTDDTLKIVSEFSHVKILRDKRQGQVFARYTGFEAAQGNLISTIDADTVVQPGWAKEIKQHYRAGNEAFGTYGYVSEGTFSGITTFLGNLLTYKVSWLLNAQYILVGANLMISRNVWDAVKHDLRLRTDLWEDLEIAILAKRHGYRTSVIRRKLVKISTRASTIGARNFYRRMMGWPKTYWPYNKFAAILSLVLMHAVFLLVMLLNATAKLSSEAKKKYSGWS